MSDCTHAFGYLTQPEVRFLDAAVARLIPADELGPGAKEADVTYFIDRQLLSTWGAHGRNYRMGPWQDGTPQQGFQSRLTPQEIYRAAIRETNVHCIKQYEKSFEFLGPERQDEGITSKTAEIAKAIGPSKMSVSPTAGNYSIVPYQSTHNCGGVVMRADPATSAVNKYLQSWDVPNVFVVGGSAFPQNSGNPPTGTIGTLACWAADSIKDLYLKRPGAMV